MKKFDKNLLCEIDLALWEDWDPIRMNNTAEARDEYQSYLPELYRLIKKSASMDEIKEHLKSIRKEYMGYCGLKENDLKTAKRLYELEKEYCKQKRLFINLDATNWKNPEDFYREFLINIKAPAWHGYSLDDLHDSLSARDINGVNPPFTLVISNTENLKSDIQGFISRIVCLFGCLKSENIDIDLLRIEKDEE